MKKFFALVFAAAACVFCIFGTGCGRSGGVADFYAFNSAVHLETHDFAPSTETLDKLRALLSSLDEEFDANGDSSVVAEINAAQAGEEVILSSRAQEVFALANKLYDFTDGKFNPAVYPLSKLWGFAPTYPVTDFSPPSASQIAITLDTAKIDRFTFENGAAIKDDANAGLDLGGIVKGYCADKAKEILLSAGHRSGYINIGGSSLFILGVESLGIRHPRKTDETILQVNLEGKTNLSVSTGGDYERYYEYGGKRYSHLIDPETGYPADTSVASVTIITENAAEADALTTAACLMPHDPSGETSPLLTFLNKIKTAYPDCMIFAVYAGEEKQIITNARVGLDFTLSDLDYSVVTV